MEVRIAHLIIIDEFGNPIEVEHDGAGNKIGQTATTFEDLLADTAHPPTKIIIREPSTLLAEIILRDCDKYYWKLKNK